MDLPDRVWRKVVMGPNGCWAWVGAISDTGYGNVWWRGKTVNVHRLMYLSQRGPIPDGLDLDHLCRNRRCCNPDHLEPVTRSTNLRRGNTKAGYVRRKFA